MSYSHSPYPILIIKMIISYFIISLHDKSHKKMFKSDLKELFYMEKSLRSFKMAIFKIINKW